jgi:hypothetical protein
LILSRLDREIGEIQKYDTDLSHQLDLILQLLTTEYHRQESKKRINNEEFSEVSEYDFRVFLSTAKTEEIIGIIDRIKGKKGKLEMFTRKLERTFTMPLNSLDRIIQGDEREKFKLLKRELIEYKKNLELIEDIWIDEMIKAIDKAVK